MATDDAAKWSTARREGGAVSTLDLTVTGHEADPWPNPDDKLRIAVFYL
jgi:hypothetical protein